MRRTERSITRFRRRLKRLIEEKFDGRYTCLARGADVPVSTLEHILLEAKRLTGGEHLLRLTRALEVTTHFLITGEEAVRPTVSSPQFAPVMRPSAEPTPRTSLSVRVPAMKCLCPGVCPLTQAVPPRPTVRSGVVVERDLVDPHNPECLLVVEVTPNCPSPKWRPGTRLVVAWGLRPLRWDALALVHAEGRCQWAHLKQVSDVLFFADDAEGNFSVLPFDTWRILGAAIAVVAPLYSRATRHREIWGARVAGRISRDRAPVLLDTTSNRARFPWTPDSLTMARTTEGGHGRVAWRGTGSSER